MGNLNAARKETTTASQGDCAKNKRLKESIYLGNSSISRSKPLPGPNKPDYCLEELDELIQSVSAFQDKIPSYEQKYLNNCVT